MEKICEFCASLRPIVFCKADSAFLCLCCDARVHSANALSNRHVRCLVCQLCREQPAQLRCLDHRLLLCHACDVTLHRNIAKLNQHQKRMVGSFTGSPSAKQFAILWGFNANQLALQDQIAGPSTSSISTAFSEQNKVAGKDEQQSSLIMQQILDLNRLQLNETNKPSSAIRERGHAHSSSSCVYNNNLGRKDESFEDVTDDLKIAQDSHFLPSPLLQSEYLSSYTALESNQFWPQNMEEPRVCEEVDGFDDLKMPEVDTTFPNFEELLRADQDLSRAFLEDDSNAILCSEHATGDSAPSSMLVDQTNHEERRIHFPNQDYQKLKRTESETKTRPSYSYSYSFSHLSAESSGSDYRDSAHSGNDLAIESAFHGRFKNKNKSRLNTKQTQLSPRKNKAEPNRKSKGR